MGGGGRGGGVSGGGVGFGGVRVDCDRRIEVFGKIHKTRFDVYETLCPQQMLVH